MPERGDLLLIPFPFTDLSAAKRRPVLALTAADSFGDFIALAVTSRPQTEHGLPLATLRDAPLGLQITGAVEQQAMPGFAVAA